MENAHIDFMPAYKVGDPEPSGYLQWHEFAAVQTRHGIHQQVCSVCYDWFFPQSQAEHAATHPVPVEWLTQRELRALFRAIEKSVRREFPTQEDKYLRDVRSAQPQGGSDA